MTRYQTGTMLPNKNGNALKTLCTKDITRALLFFFQTQGHGLLADIYSIRVQSSTTQRQLEVSLQQPSAGFNTEILPTTQKTFVIFPLFSAQVNMFLNKLTGTQIGLTAWDMFVINKPAILTVSISKRRVPRKA